MEGRVILPRTKQCLMHSRVGNRPYLILVAAPDAEPPPAGFPVIYLLDGNAVFGTMVEAMRLQVQRPEKTGVVPAVIVGIGYPTDQPFSSQRFYDFTFPVCPEELLPKPDGTPWPRSGGAGNFLSFIEEELKPEIEKAFPVDKRNQAIVGHSLGGLFVLHVLFTRPETFRSYVAGSPSIHWNRTRLLEEERNFLARLKREPVDVRVLIAVGELEKNHQSRVHENAAELWGRLGAHADRGVHAEFKVFEGENHASVLTVLMSRTLRFALGPKNDRGEQR